jgi:hypothetical protein
MSKWIVELEPGVWIGRVRGMNQPVQEKGLSRPYSRKQDAEVGITWMYKKGRRWRGENNNKSRSL